MSRSRNEDVLARLRCNVDVTHAELSNPNVLRLLHDPFQQDGWTWLSEYSPYATRHSRALSKRPEMLCLRGPISLDVFDIFCFACLIVFYSNSWNSPCLLTYCVHTWHHRVADLLPRWKLAGCQRERTVKTTSETPEYVKPTCTTTSYMYCVCSWPKPLADACQFRWHDHHASRADCDQHIQQNSCPRSA